MEETFRPCILWKHKKSLFKEIYTFRMVFRLKSSNNFKFDETTAISMARHLFQEISFIHKYEQEAWKTHRIYQSQRNNTEMLWTEVLIQIRKMSQAGCIVISMVKNTVYNYSLTSNDYCLYNLSWRQFSEHFLTSFVYVFVISLHITLPPCAFTYFCKLYFLANIVKKIAKSQRVSASSFLSLSF